MDKKYFTVMVRYWDDIVQHVVTQFLAMPVCDIASAAGHSDGRALSMENGRVLRAATLHRLAKQPRVKTCGCLAQT